jgi:single-strand selective monofunctional uracil DNA glycosylase
MDLAAQLIESSKNLNKKILSLNLQFKDIWIYNPYEYAFHMHTQYLQRFGNSKKQIIFLGMNPGPFGMVQTGIPFGEINAVKNYLKIQAEIKQPIHQHPKRPVEGFKCRKSEVSGRRLWEGFEEIYGSADEFFSNKFVLNYCPLAFMAESGRNITPDKLPAEYREEVKKLNEFCDEHLAQFIRILEPQTCIGVGAYAENCIKRVKLQFDLPIQVLRILHPSPASPLANRGWLDQVQPLLAGLPG